jgi:hypothetical protein
MKINANTVNDPAVPATNEAPTHEPFLSDAKFGKMRADGVDH